MPKKQIILYSVIGIVAILVIILLFGIFRSLRSNGYDHSEVIKAKDQTISVIIEGRAKDSLLISEKDKTISYLLKVDSVRNEQYLQSQNVYNKINEKIRSIPAYVNRVSSNEDSFRAAYSQVR